MMGYGAKLAHANPHIAHIDAVNTLALLRYSRAKDAGASLEGVATALRALPTLLRHLRQEISDGESPLNRHAERFGGSSHLHPLIEETNLVLHELGEVLDLGDEVRHRGYSERQDVAQLDRHARRIQDRLLRQKSKIQAFLDDIQLRSNPPPVPPKVPIDDDSLDCIQDKLDKISAKIFRRRDSNLGETEKDLWEQFLIELEREGFDKYKLRKNKEILRAYVRSLETSTLDQNGQNPPSVRGLLQEELHELPASPALPVDSPPATRLASVPKASTFPMDHQEPAPSPTASSNEPSMSPCLPRHTLSGLSIDKSGDDGTPSSSTLEAESMALVSTRNLLELDRQDCAHKSLNSPMSAPNLSPLARQFSQTKFPNYVLSCGTTSRSGLPPSSPQLTLPSSPPAKYSPEEPRPSYPILPAGTSFLQAPPSPVAPSSSSDEIATLPWLHGHLAPDSSGREISMEATWTKIKRSLVSPQVLEEVGVRYEARPTFVAVLGVLPREKVSELARKTAEVRASRNRRIRRSRTHEDEQFRSEQKEAQMRTRRDKGRHIMDKQDDIRNEESSSSTDHSECLADRRKKPTASKCRRDVYSSRSDMEESGPRTSNVFIVAPSTENKANPATKKPKPILKNKNENRVHFGPDGPFEIPILKEESPKGEKPLRGNKGEWESNVDRDRKDVNRDKDRYKDKDKDHEQQKNRRHREQDRRDHRDRNRDRSRERERRQKHSDLIGAAGLGGAAASLLSVLAEAAVGL